MLLTKVSFLYLNLTFFFLHFTIINVHPCFLSFSQDAFWVLVQICEKYLPGYYSTGLVRVHTDTLSVT